MKKRKQDRGTECDWSGTADRLGMEGLSDEMTFKQRPKESERVSHVCVRVRVLWVEVTVSEKYVREKLAWHIQKEQREQCVWNIVSKEENGRRSSQKNRHMN